MKWISQQSSELSLGVRIPLGAQSAGHFVQGGARRCGEKVLEYLFSGRASFQQKTMPDHTKSMVQLGITMLVMFIKDITENCL